MLVLNNQRYQHTHTVTVALSFYNGATIILLSDTGAPS